MKRLFIAIELPDGVKQKLYEIEKDFGALIAGNFVDRNKLHITLLFLGDTPIETEKIISTIRPLKAQLPVETDGLGVFPAHGGPHTLFVGVKTDLSSIYRPICSALDIVEERGFRPHITICRIKHVHGDLSPIFEKYAAATLKFMAYGPSLFDSDFKNYYKVF